MKPIRTFKVIPTLPVALEPLRRLAHNIYWDWSTEAKSLFHRLDHDLWSNTRHNPVKMLGQMSQARLEQLAQDEGFLAHMRRAVAQLDNYLLRDRIWYGQQQRGDRQECYAYFCAEYGLSYCVPIYSGGLGVLAGDHLKSASDLGLPLVAVGLLYQEGYFAQYLNADGWQQERYPINDFYNMPLHPITQEDGSELIIEVEYPGRKVYARAWRLDVGGVPLYLLDTNIERNRDPYDHDITDELYGGDIDLRIHQEMMLGIGGVRLLKALGYCPTVYHLNEGHSAFLILERIRTLMQEEGLSFNEAKQLVQSTQLFTTHTPVSAGFDMFDPDKTMYYVGHYAQDFGLGREEFLGLGRENTGDFNSPFSMAALALKTSSFINGVSQLHGEVSRRMFQGLWPGVPVEEVPITAITNGVHARSIVAISTQDLYDRYLGPNWDQEPGDRPLWEKVKDIPDEELWRNHERCRSDLVVFIRRRLIGHLARRGATDTEMEKLRQVLNPHFLTIGFARRFATYKRANLFMRDLARLKTILQGNKDRQVQFLIAGKAHPKDIPGKELIRQIIHMAREEGLEDHVVFVPGYNLHVARKMVAGCDVWLNTPRRPREASGTSGMKAAMNGLLNVSILDGWWDEADFTGTGWAIGQGEMYDDPDYQDQVEASALYDLLEKEIVPLFYDRNALDVPTGWVQKMKANIRLNCPRFNTARMVRDYATRAYFPISDRHRAMTADHYQAVKDLAIWKHRLFEQWYNIKITDVSIPTGETVQVGQAIPVAVSVSLAGLRPEDVQLEIFTGPVDDQQEIQGAQTITMLHQNQQGDSHRYTAEVIYECSGHLGFALRILPQHPHLADAYEPRLVHWT